MLVWQREFPDFPPADMPEIPAGWEDTSWHNDTCPSFQRGNLRLCVDYLDPAKREFGVLGCRFAIHALDADNAYSHTVIESDDWATILADIADAGV